MIITIQKTYYTIIIIDQPKIYLLSYRDWLHINDQAHKFS